MHQGVLQFIWLCVGAELQQLLGLELGAISSFLSLAANSSDRLQGELTLLVMRLCANCPAALRAVCSLRRKVVTTDSAGAPNDQQVSGLELVKRLLLNGTELSRACACGLLGELALYSEDADKISPPVDQSTSGATSDDSAVESMHAKQSQLIRAHLLNDRTVDVMLEVLYEVTNLLVRSGGVKEAPEATVTTTTNARQSRRSTTKAAAAVCLLFLMYRSCNSCASLLDGIGISFR
jgi:hypothetical protein